MLYASHGGVWQQCIYWRRKSVGCSKSSTHTAPQPSCCCRLSLTHLLSVIICLKVLLTFVRSFFVCEICHIGSAAWNAVGGGVNQMPMAWCRLCSASHFASVMNHCDVFTAAVVITLCGWECGRPGLDCVSGIRVRSCDCRLGCSYLLSAGSPFSCGKFCQIPRRNLWNSATLLSPNALHSEPVTQKHITFGH